MYSQTRKLVQRHFQTNNYRMG